MKSAAGGTPWHSLRFDIMAGSCVIATLAVLPFFEPGRFVLGQITLYLIWAAVVTQWNLVLGVAGILSIGHMALFAAGGYTVALLGTYVGGSAWAALPFAGLAGFAVGLAMGLVSLRLRGPYVVVVTLCFAVSVYHLIVTDVTCFRHVQSVCYSLTGGSRGLTRYGDFGLVAVLGYANAYVGNYYLALAALAVGTLFAMAVFHSPYGRAFQAMRDNEVCARCRGIGIAKYQMIVFGAAGFFTGVSGGVYAGIMKTFGPNVLELPTLLFLLSMMIVGGRGHVWGPICGAVAVYLADESLRPIAEWRGTGFALILIVIVLVAPNGLASALGALRKLAQRRISLPVGRLFRQETPQ